MAPEVQIARRGRPLGSPFSQWLNFRLVPFLAAHLVKLLAFTLRVQRVDEGPVEALVRSDQRFILAFWHRRLLMMPLAYPFRRKAGDGTARGVAILSSDSKDGERSAATWRWFGIHAVRGTGSAGRPRYAGPRRFRRPRTRARSRRRSCGSRPGRRAWPAGAVPGVHPR